MRLCRRSCGFYIDVFQQETKAHSLVRSHLFGQQGLSPCEKEEAASLSTKTWNPLHRNTLTWDQQYLKTCLFCITVIASHVKVLKVINADGEVPLWALVGKGFHSATSRVQEVNTSLRWETDQFQFCLSVEPCNPFDVALCYCARKKNRRTKWSSEILLLTKLQNLTCVMVLLILFHRRDRKKRNTA